MELYELYGIIGQTIIVITEFFIGYCIIKLVKIYLYELCNDNSKLNKIIKENHKEKHFNKHFKKWLKNKELQKKYNNFNEYYEKEYNKQFMYSKVYNDFIKYKENKEKEKWQKK